jgi:GDP-L-fucose synthase
MLVDLGAIITVPVRKTTDQTFLASVRRRIEIIECDLSNQQGARTCLKGKDVVLHLAAAKGGGIVHSMAHHGSLFRDNLLSFINVIEAARQEAMPRFLVVSSACVYPRELEIPIREDDGFTGVPEPTNAGYGWSKRMEEYMALAYADEFGMNVGIVRPFNAFGPRDDFFHVTNHVIPGLITRLFAGENPLVVWGTGRQTRSFLYVTDFARGVLMAGARTDVKGPLNLCAEEEISIGDLARLIVEASGQHVPIRFDTSKPDGQPRRAGDGRQAKAQLGFSAQVPLLEGIRRTIDWYKKEQKRRIDLL